MHDGQRFFGKAVGRFDAAVDDELDRLRGHPLAGRVLVTASALGDWSLCWQLLGAAKALANPRRVPDFLRLSVTLGVESLLVNQGVKRFFYRHRPWFDAEAATAGGLRIPTTSSFPSGHASAGFCAAVLLTNRQPKLAPVWFAMAAVVSLSRVYVRMHHASDIVIGAAIGAAIGEIAALLVPLPP